MSNNFVREGNLSGDAVLDGVAQKLFFESVKIGTGSPSAAPSPASKVWLYADRSQNPAIMWLWDPSTATWHITGDGTGTGVVDSVNGQTGIVVLDHTDVGAEEAGAVADLAATLATVATSGDYDDLINKPTIPDISNLVENTDPRLSDARTPTAHTHPQSDVTGLVSDLAAKVADTDPRLSDARTPLAHTHAATAVTSVPATTGLDPASTNVEAALTELAARPSGGTFPILCTSTTRPTEGLFTGMHIYETDTGTLLVYAGATAGFRPPWNLPWGRVAHTKITAVAGGYTGTAVDVTGLTASVSQVAGRRYRIQVHLEVSSSQVTDIGLLTVTGSDNVAIARAVPYFAHGGAHTVTLTHVEDASSTATVTRKCRYNRAIGSGTHQIEASSQFPCTILIEDIGPTGNPS